jgi:hypothetical protein
MNSAICKWTVRVLVVLYAIALVIGLIGTFGWFGQERDALSWVFVIMLGQPWVALIGDVSDPVRPWLAAFAPLLNLFILAALCRAVSARRKSSG